MYLSNLENVKEVNPLKQGLKLLADISCMSFMNDVKEVNPLKQGLKHSGSHVITLLIVNC